MPDETVSVLQIKMASGFIRGSAGFPPVTECGDYKSLQRAAFLTDYTQSARSNRPIYSQDTKVELTNPSINLH